MRILTPELWAYSVMSASDVGAVVETRELDFSLARRSAVVISQIEGFLHVGNYTTVDHSNPASIVQEVDLDPDNINVWLAAAFPLDDSEIDSSRCFRQMKIYNADTAAGLSEAADSQKLVDWRPNTMQDRPITTRNIRHHLHTGVAGGGNLTYQAEVCIRYFIVELTLSELGYINASRR